MYKSKLYLLYKTLDKKAQRMFRKWVCSPIHNEHVFVQQLFYFLDTRKSYTMTTLSKKRAWKYLYKEEPYNDLRMRHIMSIAFEVLEKFVRYKLSEKSIFFQEKMLISYFFEQKLEKQAYKKLSIAQKILEKQGVDEKYYYQQYELEVLQLEHSSQQNRSGKLNINAVLDNARLFFMLTTLRHAYTALMHQRLRKVEYEIPMLESILSEIANNDYSEYPVLQVYYHSYFTLKTPEDTSHFSLLKSYLYEDKLSVKEKRNTLLICINYAIRQINLGKLDYAKETFELYQYGIESRCLLEEEKISAYTYKNIVTVGLNLKEYDWIESFINDYSTCLPKHLQDSYQHFNTAKLAFDKGYLTKAMDLLVQVEYDEVLLNIDAKVILLKIYYQKGYYDALDALLDSFRVFLSRKKELTSNKKNYTNLMAFIKRMPTLLLEEGGVESLRVEIETTPQLAERKWLLEQL